MAAEQEGDYVYTVTDEVATITDYTGEGGAITIPSTLGGYPVTFIGWEAFGGNTNLTSVTIPGSVISIGRLAFVSCTSLTSVTISEGVRYIHVQAFMYCNNLTSVTIPGSVRSIGDYAFDHCISLTSIAIPDGVATLGEYAFARCSSLNSATIPGSVTTVGYSIFRECTSLTSVTISEGLTTISKSMFLQCSSLTSVTLPSSLTTIWDSAFSNCANLTQVTFNGNAPTCFGYFFSNHNSSLVVYYYAGATGFTNPWQEVPTVELSRPTDFTYRLINGDAEVEITGYTGSSEAVTIPSTIDGRPVTSIGESAFNNENGHLITSVVIPDSVNTIGALVFASNPVLKSVTLGSGVRIIGDYAFAACTSLGPMVIPDSVMYINGGAFEGCTGMTYATIGSGVIVIGGVAFNACSSLADIEVSADNAVYASVDGVVYSKDLRTLVTYPAGRYGAYEIPYGVTTIGGSAMSSCPWITSLTIPDSVTYIGYGGLAGTSLTSITIPDSVTEIGAAACVFSPALTSVTVGSGVTTIGYRAFAYCPSLTSITFTGLVAPTIVGGDWVGLDNPSNLEGHAYTASDFPAPGQYFYGLLMGDYIYTAPTVDIDSPADGSYVRTSTVTVKWSAVDKLSEVDYFKVKLDSGKWVQVIGDTYTFTRLKAGVHTVTVQAYGDTGLLAETSSTFTIDSTAPSLRITSPLNGATVRSSSMTVQWAASDPSGVDYCMVRLDSGAWVKVEDASSYSFTGLANGKHTVTVQAFDSAGNSKTATVKFTVRA